MGPGSVPSRGNKILQAARHGQTKKNTDYYKNNEHHSSREYSVPGTTLALWTHPFSLQL